MAGWTKADFDENYSIRVERYMPGGGPGPSEGRKEVRLCYHRAVIKPMLETYWKNLVPSVYDIKRGDTVVVVGAAFGWGVEALIALTGANVVGIDISDYVARAKDTDESDEIDACIKLVGLDPTQGRGLEIKNTYYTPGPRCTTTVLQEDMETPESRKRVLKALNSKSIDWTIKENID